MGGARPVGLQIMGKRRCFFRRPPDTLVAVRRRHTSNPAPGEQEEAGTEAVSAGSGGRTLLP